MRQFLLLRRIIFTYVCANAILFALGLLVALTDRATLDCSYVMTLDAADRPLSSRADWQTAQVAAPLVVLVAAASGATAGYFLGTDFGQFLEGQQGCR